jgi:hypothetical protein
MPTRRFVTRPAPAAVVYDFVREFGKFTGPNAMCEDVGVEFKNGEELIFSVERGYEDEARVERALILAKFYFAGWWKGQLKKGSG